MELELEPPEEEDPLMTDEDFDRETQMLADGRLSELDLDELPENWRAASIEDLRNEQ